MDSFPLRGSINRYVKRLLDSWVPAAFIVIVFLGLGTGVVVQQISHTSKQLKQQYELLDLMNFNQQLIDTNHKLRTDNEKAIIQIQHMDNFIQQMYNRLRQHEDLGRSLHDLVTGENLQAPESYSPENQKKMARKLTRAAVIDNNATDNNATDNNATAHNIDFDFIHAREGARRPDFYVPRDDNNRALENSGVTIASGFDIGQHNTNEITTLFAGHDDIILALTPFANVRRQPAVELLNRTRPEDLNSTQIQTIERIVDVDRAAAVVTTFNNNNQLDGNATFNQLPSEFQTVIASVTFQYGNLETETPNLYRQVMNGLWDEVLTNLRNFGDSFPSRRNLEGDLWERGLLRLRQQRTP